MTLERAIALVENLLVERTGKPLNDLQLAILKQVWQRKKYLDIARSYCCTEGHVKDAAYLLWKTLSEALGEKIAKNNVKNVLERRLKTETSKPSEGNLLTPNANFVGRESAIAQLNSLAEAGNKIILIQGEGGIGKTTLAQEYFSRHNFEVYLELLMAKETPNITSVESVVEEWLRQDFQEEPGREFGVTLGRLKRHLETRRIGILIDNLEPILDRDGKIISPHRSYVELLRILADAKVRSTTLITSRDRLCESAFAVARYRLPGLDLEAWQQFFDLQTIQSDSSDLQPIHQIYGGNAKAMRILCGVIREDFGGDIRAYWQENQNNPLVETNLKNLVSSQFDRLQNLDSDGYKLLCRLGCYRYQDIPTISQSALFALLWDIDSNGQVRAIESLKNRSLIEYSRGKYWLHPVIRSEAIARLKRREDWQITNSNAAKFWTDSVQKIITARDAIVALEAYYHYVVIENFEAASKVILKSRDNQWGQFLPLGSTLYRMGLVQPIFSAINQIINCVKEERDLSEICNILGDLFWIKGKIHRAIACQEKTLFIVNRGLSSEGASNYDRHTLYYLKMLTVDSLLSIGLYQIDLWELPKAAELFAQVIEKTKNTAHYRWGEKASVCLALVNSYLGFEREALLAADIIYDGILTGQLFTQAGRFAYFMQILAQTYVNLGSFEKALEMYRSAIAFSETSHYLQVKGKALTGLGEIARRQTNFDLALGHHGEAIEILESIGAKCDLAEAYFQQGITYRELGEFQNSRINYERAIELFAEMEAPKQVKKVREQLDFT